MDKKEAQLIIQRIDKILGKSVKKEELEEVQLNEIQIPTLGAFVRGHRILNEYLLLFMTVFPKETLAHRFVAALQKPLGAFVDAMDEFWSENKVLFGLLFGSMLAVDLFGTSAVVAKEKLLQIFRKKLVEAYNLEDAGAPKPTDAAGLPDPDVIDAEFTEKSPEGDQALQEKFDRMKNLAGIKKVL